MGEGDGVPLMEADGRISNKNIRESTCSRNEHGISFRTCVQWSPVRVGTTSNEHLCKSDNGTSTPLHRDAAFFCAVTRVFLANGFPGSHVLTKSLHPLKRVQMSFFPISNLTVTSQLLSPNLHIACGEVAEELLEGLHLQ